MKITFWGVRGSIPVSDPTVRFWGGETSCVLVEHEDLPPLVFGCGTGARALGQELLSRPGRELDLLFTHCHMDHIFGFPFFLPIYTPGFDVRVTMPAFTEDDARKKLGGFLNGIYHPVKLRELPARVTFNPVRPGSAIHRGGYQVVTTRLNHPGGAVGYRVNVGGVSMCYITDTSPFAKVGEGVCSTDTPTLREMSIMAFMHEADVVIYDTMYSFDEYLEKMTFGHSYPEYAHSLCAAASVKKLVLFHHAPDAVDETLDALEEKWAKATAPAVSLARQGVTMIVEG